MSGIFISYNNKEKARLFATLFEQQGWLVFWDKNILQLAVQALKRLEHFVFQYLSSHHMLDIAGDSRHLIGVAMHLLKDHRTLEIR